MQRTVFICSNCSKELNKSEREYLSKNTLEPSECTECRFHRLNGTRTIEKYNEWLKK